MTTTLLQGIWAVVGGASSAMWCYTEMEKLETEQSAGGEGAAGRRKRESGLLPLRWPGEAHLAFAVELEDRGGPHLLLLAPRV